MEKVISKEFLENEKLLNRLMENSYYVKYLNRNPNYFKIFKKDMEIIYKERPTDKLNNMLDGVDMISSIIDTMK